MILPVVNIKHIRELKNKTELFIQPEDSVTRECLFLSSNLQEAFFNATVNARNTLPNQKSSPNFVTVNVHHIINSSKMKDELLNNNAMDVIKVTRITSRITADKVNESNHQLKFSSQRCSKTWS